MVRDVGAVDDASRFVGNSKLRVLDLVLSALWIPLIARRRSQPTPFRNVFWSREIRCKEKTDYVQLSEYLGDEF